MDPILDDMKRYYADRVPYHDLYMGYSGNERMEELLWPIIRLVEKDVAGKDVLEIACGTGNWTQVLSKRARSVVAADLIDEYTAIAKNKVSGQANVNFRVADAYNLDGIEGEFDAAFAADWWSHMPRSRIAMFLGALHGKLLPAARVVMLDMLPSPELESWYCFTDKEGNIVQKRALPNGRTYRVIKNFPSESELRGCLAKWASNIAYHENRELKRWIVGYTSSRSTSTGLP